MRGFLSMKSKVMYVILEMPWIYAIMHASKADPSLRYFLYKITLLAISAARNRGNGPPLPDELNEIRPGAGISDGSNASAICIVSCDGHLNKNEEVGKYARDMVSPEKE